MTMPTLVALRHLALLSALLAATSGCEFLPAQYDEGQAGDLQAFEVHLNSQFSNDRVQVFIDGKEVFDERVTTLDVLSLAEVIALKRPAGHHRIEVVVNRKERKAATFSLTEALYIHVWYRPEGIPELNIPQGIAIEPSRHRPIYD